VKLRVLKYIPFAMAAGLVLSVWLRYWFAVPGLSIGLLASVMIYVVDKREQHEIRDRQE
jgi:hypothetical protein